MPILRTLARLAALAAAVAVVVFVAYTALKKQAPSAVSDVRVDPSAAVFPEPAKKPKPAPPPPPAPKVFGITPSRSSAGGEGGPVGGDPSPRP